jgi:DNA-binding CsgD family transcriptional regulator
MNRESRIGDPLTPQELRVAERLIVGDSNAEIGKVLHLSPHTIKFHVINVIAKLGCRNRTDAAVKFARQIDAVNCAIHGSTPSIWCSKCFPLLSVRNHEAIT